ncbi:hypothetical protein DBR32_05615 [Taibaiella sp. KBW10]|uniref:T9SS type B sorting domain-containing protein n=1 Tax=Taibaiella sp. KBW10 TaxID=2153357 RepID=UPI000F592534|nr:gliding motility-associated C-terminal domain-containing protein [Taibaiella sp. KBW10]RQO31439.1 hypothetical protein DBR32_05615 [Taibaiella sp. KBW10]
MKKIYRIWLPLLFMLLSGSMVALAQGENKQWHFGMGHHINFNTTPPSYNQNSNMATFESSAAVSDAQGNLLFYTIGCRIWDRNGNQMPNATGLLGNGPSWGTVQGSGQESVQILPNPANSNQYYVFSANASEDGMDKVYYHIVDMSLNGGLGDVIPASKNTLLLDAGLYGITENTGTAYGDCNNYWYIVLTKAPCQYYAFKVDANGVSTTPVISTPNIPVAEGSFKVSNLRQASYTASNSGDMIRSSFNKTTGIFSNFGTIPNTATWHFELSPDEQILYTSDAATIKQFNLQLYPNLTAIGASVTTVGTGGPHFDFRLAPDGKIYVSSIGNYIGRIEQPNLIGPACTFTPQFFTVTGTASSLLLARLGPNNLKPPHNSSDTIRSHTSAMLLCEEDSVVLENLHPGNTTFYWYDGSNADHHTITQPGTYWVRSSHNACTLYIDTFTVSRSPAPLILGKDTMICKGHEAILNAFDPRFDHYEWSDGSTGTTLTVNTPGTYYVTVQAGPCTFSDSIKLGITEPEINILQADTSICSGSTIYVSASTNMNSAIYWNSGQSGPSIPISKPGTYVASTQNMCGIQSDTLLLTEINCDCVPIIPNSFTPNRDGRNDVFMPVFPGSCDAKFYELHIYNRYGQLVFSSFQRDRGWDGTYQGNTPADPGTYFYIVKVINRYGAEDKPLTLKGDISLIR